MSKTKEVITTVCETHVFKRELLKECYLCRIAELEAENKRLKDAIERYRQAKEHALANRIAPPEHYPDYMETEKAMFTEALQGDNWYCPNHKSFTPNCFQCASRQIEEALQGDK